MSRNEAALFAQPEYLDALLVDHTEQLLGLLGRDGRLIRANRRLAALCGDPEPKLLGRVLWSAPLCNCLGSAPDDLRRAFEAAARGKTARLAGAGAQPARDLELVLRPVPDRAAHPAYIVLEGRQRCAPERPADASELRLLQADQAVMRRQLAQITQIYQRAPIGLGLIDRECRFLHVNRQLAEMNGLAAEAHVGRDLREVAPELAATVEALYAPVLEHGGEARGLVVRRDNAGSAQPERRWSVDLHPCRGESGEIIGAIVAVAETSERTGTHKASVRAPDHLSRLYAAISETNKALVRCDTPEEIYRAVCHAAVEYGGFRLAWIGIADVEAERIVPVEAAGPAVSLLQGLVVSTREDEPQGRGTTGRAYREQRACLSAPPESGLDDTAAEAREHPTAANGPRFAIALPLQRGGEPFGALTVYGDEEKVFDAEAVRLLQDMADNVSFALDLFDRESLRQQTDAALRASEARLLEAQAVSRMGDWELDRDTGRMSWSQQLFRLFERRIEDGPPDLNEALAYYTPESLERTRDRFWEVIDTGQTAEFEQVVVLPSGRTRYHATVIVPVQSPSGRIVKLYGTVQDITERKLAERELIRRTDEVEDLYQNAPCGYQSLDPEGRIIRINNTELQWLGYAREEVFGRMTAYDILSPECHAAFEEDFFQLKRSGCSRVLELELLRKDGTTVPVLASSTALFDAAGEFVAARTMLADDSQRKLLERERAAYVARLAELSRRLVDVQENERRQLAGDLHDHASPNLAALRITFANLASALPPAVLQEVEPLLDDAHALLLDTTTGIRDICTSLRPATLDYAGLIPALREYAAHFSRRTNIEIAIEQDDFNASLLPNVQSLLFRITQEALTNAAKHALAKKVVIRLADSAAEVTLTITDDGIGFEPQALGKSGASPGLGLITMKERAEFAGGTFSVRSRPGEGTRITVIFDKHARMHGRRASDPPHDSAGAGLSGQGPGQQPAPPIHYK